MSDDLAATITKRYQELLDNAELTPQQLTAALAGASKWWSIANPEPTNGDGKGAGFKEDDDERAC